MRALQAGSVYFGRFYLLYVRTGWGDSVLPVKARHFAHPRKLLIWSQHESDNEYIGMDSLSLNRYDSFGNWLTFIRRKMQIIVPRHASFLASRNAAWSKQYYLDLGLPSAA